MNEHLTCRTCGGPIDHNYFPDGEGEGFAKYIHVGEEDGDDGHEAVPLKDPSSGDMSP